MLTETLVSSLLLSLSIVLSLSLWGDSMRALSRSTVKDRRMAEISAINENVRHEVSKWRKLPDDTGAKYDTDKSVCGDNMAQLLLDEMKIDTPNRLTAEGHHVISHNDGFTDVVIYLPQSGWCP